MVWSYRLFALDPDNAWFNTTEMKTTQMTIAGLVEVCGLVQAGPLETDFATIGFTSNAANTNDYGVV
jgi:hypothetical protein